MHLSPATYNAFILVYIIANMYLTLLCKMMANKPLPVATGILKITFFTFKHFSFCKFIRLLLLNSYLYFLVSFYNLGGNRVDILVLKLLLHFFTK